MWVTWRGKKTAALRRVSRTVGVDRGVDRVAGGVDHELMLWVSESIVFLNLGSSRSIPWILSTA
jgi:hypothetical protein